MIKVAVVGAGKMGLSDLAIVSMHPDVQVVGVCDTSTYLLGVRADILLVAMSSPRKEYWLSRHLDQLGVRFAMGVGGSIDVVAGVTRRAPPAAQRLGLEWLFRLVQEPRRLFVRYAVTNVRFLLTLQRELIHSRLAQRRA